MSQHENLKHYLKSRKFAGELHDAVGSAILDICTASESIARVIARGALAENLSSSVGKNVDGDVQKHLDLIANDFVMTELRESSVAELISEELDEPMTMSEGAPLCVAIDPLDGSSNIETNSPTGTIFSVLPAADALQPGTHQLAAGYVIYGAQTELVLTLGNGTDIFTLDPETRQFFRTRSDVSIPPSTNEYAINASNFRQWEPQIRSYVNDLLEGKEGCREENFNMRWLASLVGETHRVLSRGGVFLYPGDARKGYSYGRLRLLYEVNPISFLIEQAGGSATTGHQRPLEIQPDEIHQRVPMIFGSSKEISRIESYCSESTKTGQHQLFKKRGLFNS